MKAAALVLALTVTGCVTAGVVDSETKSLEAQVSKLKNGKESAIACAPAEYALAETRITFSRFESHHGNTLAAKEHLGEAQRLMGIVMEKAQGKGCDGDRDGDGIPDSIDKCPDIPEDFDGDQDEDGCPDFDKDGDGIPDDRDKCPNDPEDKDGFQDQDGCPEFDNDKDGLLDQNDQCPNAPEDFDGFQDLDGCPDPDNDGDDIPDVQDKCPNTPGLPQSHGCPDNYRWILVTDDGIELKQPIFFKPGAAGIDAKSNPVLDDLVAALKAAPKLKVSIEGHTDSQGASSANMKVSRARADGVKRYLTSHGISGSRLKSVGFGGDKPIDDNDTAEGRATNNRVEFHIIKQ